MSVAVAQPSVQARVLAFLSTDERAEILEHGKPDTDGNRGSGGPLEPNVNVRGDGLYVQVYEPWAWEMLVTYHLWCREHGYPTGERCGVETPPTPGFREGDSEERVTWGQVRAWLRETQHGEQLDLLGAAA